MDEEASDFFTVRRAPNDDRLYVTRKDQPVCSRPGVMLYFETEREALEFLAEIGDVVMS